MENQPPKTASPSSISKRRSNPTSKSFLPLQRHRGLIPQRITTGAKMRSPAASPSHHVIQLAPYLAHSAKHVSARLATPIVERTVVLSTTAKDNLKTFHE